MSSGRYSGFRLLREAMAGHQGWRRAWHPAEAKPHYRIAIIGGGGHGLASAYHLAKTYGIRDIAVLEQGAIGQGNLGRNTTIVRSNYFTAPNIRFYDAALQGWERFEQELNFNAMVSQRGTLNLIHTEGQRDLFARRANAMALEGVDAEYVDPAGVKALVPLVELTNARYPVLGGFLQRRGGTVRHDAVGWAYARAASDLGVDIVEHTGVIGITPGHPITLSTTAGPVTAERVLLAVAGHSSTLAAMAGFRLPIETYALQAFVTESVKPVLDLVVTYGGGHFYASQSDKGGIVFGGATDGHNSYAQRGSWPQVEETMTAGLTLMPALSRLKVLRQWAGVMDMSMDGSPIVSDTPVPHLYLSTGWCYGGFKAIPAGGLVAAHLVATGTPHPLAEHFRLGRFRAGAQIDERGAGPYPWAH